MTTKDILLLLQARGFRFVKPLGQNFLMDEAMLERIVQAAQVEGENVLEIGAGAGCLTQALARRAKRVLAVEIDRNLQPVLDTVLAPYKQVRVLMGDALKLDLPAQCAAAFGGEAFVVTANLPYGITTDILGALLDTRLQVKRMCLMLQKEAGERVMSAPGEAGYGPLAIRCAYRCTVNRLFAVPPQLFLPQPKVDSVVMELIVHPVDAMSEAKLMRVVRAAFAMRRKTLLNNLAAAGLGREKAAAACAQADIDAGARAESLTLRQFQRLAQSIEF